MYMIFENTIKLLNSILIKNLYKKLESKDAFEKSPVELKNKIENAREEYIKEKYEEKGVDEYSLTNEHLELIRLLKHYQENKNLDNFTYLDIKNTILPNVVYEIIKKEFLNIKDISVLFHIYNNYYEVFYTILKDFIDNIISNSLEKNSVNIYKNTNFNKLINFYNFDDGIYYLYERTRKTINEELNDKNSIYFGISYNESLESLKYLLIKNINIIYEKNKNKINKLINYFFDNLKDYTNLNSKINNLLKEILNLSKKIKVQEIEKLIASEKHYIEIINKFLSGREITQIIKSNDTFKLIIYNKDYTSILIQSLTDYEFEILSEMIEFMDNDFYNFKSDIIYSKNAI